MAYHGMPLLGDVKYGSSISKEISQSLGIRQVALCANRITFRHPVTGKELSFEVAPENKAFSKFQ
jgi:23S rRNA pseudouridine1911/1915/1917 synthase